MILKCRAREDAKPLPSLSTPIGKMLELTTYYEENDLTFSEVFAFSTLILGHSSWVEQEPLQNLGVRGHSHYSFSWYMSCAPKD